MTARPRSGRTAAAVAAAAASALLLVGCGHIQGLRPVEPDQRTKVRIAAIDVLSQNGYELARAPQCQDDGDGVRCLGTTADGDAVVVTSPLEMPLTMRIAVGGEPFFDGAVAGPIVDEADGS